ncbi:MAG: hypothetical protein F6J93_23935 [Oscillatoria sp. SIO1A7]|nr:hypothetical protein [Oscillatoria sp. SIO1A7]
MKIGHPKCSCDSRIATTRYKCILNVVAIRESQLPDIGLMCKSWKRAIACSLGDRSFLAFCPVRA